MVFRCVMSSKPRSLLNVYMSRPRHSDFITFRENTGDIRGAFSCKGGERQKFEEDTALGFPGARRKTSLIVEQHASKRGFNTKRQSPTRKAEGVHQWCAERRA